MMEIDENYLRKTDALAVGLTRPAKILGVPLMPYYFNCMLCFLGAMLLTSLTNQGFKMAILFFTIFSIIHVVMITLALKDSFGLTIFWMTKTKFSRHSTFERWGYTDSFAL
jgi:type IV secretory pathway VirB3-like protein